MSAKDPVKGDPRSEAGMTLQEAGMTLQDAGMAYV